MNIKKAENLKCINIKSCNFNQFNWKLNSYLNIVVYIIKLN